MSIGFCKKIKERDVTNNYRKINIVKQLKQFDTTFLHPRATKNNPKGRGAWLA